MATAADSTRSRQKKDYFGSSGLIFKGRSTFAIAALMGGAMIFLGDELHSPYIIGVFGPIAIMIAYMVLGLLGYIEISDNESFADSIYYLGFILTLVSLSAALFYLRKKNIELPLLVSKFGLALLTTIIGLSVRVAIVNFKVAGNDARRAANDRLTHAMDRFTKDIELTCDKLELLLSGSLEQVQTTAAEVSSATTLATKTMQEETKQTSKHIRVLHEKSEQHWEETITKLATDLNNLVSNATEFSIERLKSLNEKIHTEMESFHLPQDIVTSKFNPALDDLETVVGNFAKKINTEMDSFHLPRDIVTSKFNPVLDDLETVVGNFALNMNQLVDASAGHKELRLQFDDFGSALGSGTKSIKELRNIAGSLISSYENLKLLSERIDQLGVQLEVSAESLDRWSSTVGESETILKDGADAGRLSISALAQEIKKFVAMSRVQSENISQLVTDIGADAKAGQEALSVVQQNLIDSSRVIVENLKP